jgi:hypothetical protein
MRVIPRFLKGSFLKFLVCSPSRDQSVDTGTAFYHIGTRAPQTPCSAARLMILHKIIQVQYFILYEKT